MSKDYSDDKLRKMHTAEHVLNATMVKLLGSGRCFSSHINADKSKCDYHFHRPVTDAEMTEVEKQINEVLRSNSPVTESFMPRAEAETAFNLSRLPEGAGDSLRIVRVGDYDACPCSGQHVENTSEVGLIRITSHSFEDGVLRLRFKLR